MGYPNELTKCLANIKTAISNIGSESPETIVSPSLPDAECEALDKICQAIQDGSFGGGGGTEELFKFGGENGTLQVKNSNANQRYISYYEWSNSKAVLAIRSISPNQTITATAPALIDGKLIVSANGSPNTYTWVCNKAGAEYRSITSPVGSVMAMIEPPAKDIVFTLS